MSRERDPLVVGRVVGDGLDPFTRSIGLSVVHGNREVTNGCEFRPSHVVNQPRVDVGGDDLRTFYTLVVYLLSVSSNILKVMVDPDALSPSKPNLIGYLQCLKGARGVRMDHLHSQLVNIFGVPDKVIYDNKKLVTDIPGTTAATFGQEIVCYDSPRPSMGIHRFVFVYCSVNWDSRLYMWWQNFSTRDFAELYNHGSHVAAVYYNCHRENGTGGRRR